MRLVALGLLAVLLALAAPTPAHVTPSSPSHYLPQAGDALVVREYVNVSGGFGNYSGYTETDAVTGYLNITAVLANGTDTATYAYLGHFQNTTTSYSWQAKGTFTFSARSYRYVVGTDNQSGLNRSGVWFYTNSSATVGSTFSALDYPFSVGSRDASFLVHAGSGGSVATLYADSNGTYARNDIYGDFQAGYSWRSYYDPSTGYVVGYVYAEFDSDGQGDGFLYTEVLRVTSTSFALSPAPSPAVYSVTIDARGLGSPPSWTLDFDTRSLAETTDAVTLPGVPNGTYLYAARASGYSPSPAYAWVSVHGSSASGSVGFASTSSGSTPLAWLTYALIALFVVVVVVVVIYLVLRRSRPLPRHPVGGRLTYAPAPPGPAPPPISLSPGDQPRIQQVVLKEVVKVKCQYCGSLIDSTAPACPFCGATRS
jgi:hypothetical protein